MDRKYCVRSVHYPRIYTCSCIILYNIIPQCIFFFFSTESCGQGTVTVSPDVTADNGSPTTLSCTYTVDNNYLLYNLEWRRGESVRDSFRIADFVNDVDQPIYYSNFSSSEYTASRDKINRVALLAIASVRFQDDSELFWCNIQVYTSGSVTQISDSIEVIVTGMF